jgi:hypothetical protein
MGWPTRSSAPNTASGLATTSPVRIGSVGYLQVREGFWVAVRVKDSRNRYGILDYFVEPTGGSGEAWVQADRIEKRPPR